MAERPLALIDQGARDLAREAIAKLDRHEAVCAEAERRRALQIQDMKDTLQKGIEAIRKGYEQAYSDMSIRHSNAVTTMASSWSDRERERSDRERDRAAEVSKLNGRYWQLLWSYAGAVTIIAGVLAANKLGI